MLPSLRAWLQNTALLTVIAGYTVLLVVNGALADWQRRQNHQRLLAALLQQSTLEQLDSVPLRTVGLEATLRAKGPELSPRLTTGPAGEQWLESRKRLRLPSGDIRWLALRQNVSGSLEQERFSQLLLIAAAGVSILFTSVLLRPVLRRGLVVPLNELDQQLQLLEADNLGEHLLDPARQPQELEGIAIAINNLQQRLAAAWQRERQFADGVAHELRTPITLISGRSQRLLRKPHAPEQHQPLQQIAEEASRMAALIRSLLELARRDSGRLQLDLQPCDPEQMLLEAFERLSALAAGRLQLAPAKDSGLPALAADPQRLQECLLALVDNALAYSEASVHLRASLECSEQQQWVVLHVLDRGPGIAVSERSQVLARFARGSSSVGTRGSGIGLAVVQELITAMGAELVIADRAGGGADVQLVFRV
ncbi:HAMP domain-containing sensor histidine kinase [Synechococcus sp. UW140]|uniref:sensor histidine kinase n=1 Tax=Synechococcus sp. UW140 TaxID=368503 RepID=UPI001FCC751B|nr:HAMP domain-containing sensor histidine kinase [Synechococcus sp. UW140]